MLLFDALERAVAVATRDEPAVVRARDAWNRQAGQVHDDEPLYEERTNAFLEWFTLDAADQSAVTPPPILAQITRSADHSLERAALVALATSHRSIFRVRELVPEGLLLDDLWGGAAFEVRERRRLAGIEPGDLVDARLVADVESPPDLVFARTFCPHPREVHAEIRRHVARARKDGESRTTLLFHLLRLRVRCERYRHVPAARVYGVDGGKLA